MGMGSPQKLLQSARKNDSFWWPRKDKEEEEKMKNQAM